MLKRSALRVHATAALHLKDAAGRPMFFTPTASAPGEKVKNLPVRISVYGPGSEEYMNAQQAAQRRLLDMAKEGADLQARSPEERARATADLLASITVGVEGIDLEGKPLADAVRDLYADPACGYIRDQVNSFAADWANFSSGAPKA